MLFLFFRIESEDLKLSWRPVSVLLVFLQMWLNLKGRSTRLRSPEARGDEELVVPADLTVLLLLAPSLALNLLYAFH